MILPLAFLLKFVNENTSVHSETKGTFFQSTMSRKTSEIKVLLFYVVTA